MRPVLPAIAIVLALGACSKAAPNASPAAPPMDAASERVAAPASAAATGGHAGSIAKPAAPVTAPRSALALSFTYGLVLPADQVRKLMDRHQAACEQAGPDQCQVLNAQTAAAGKDEAQGTFVFRAAPAWMTGFRGHVEADAKAAGGKIDAASTAGEDLSRPIVDLEAAQRSRQAELDRLRALMSERNADLSDTLEIERELTRVQTEMDQAASELAVMQGRVDMQTMTVGYRSEGALAPDSAMAPLAKAAQSFLGNVIAVVAFLVTLLSYLLPLILLGGAIAWGVLRWRRSRPPKPPAPAATTAPPAS